MLMKVRLVVESNLFDFLYGVPPLTILLFVKRLFFLNGEQDLSAFLLVDLGLVKYPTYVCNVSQPIFLGRNDFVAYEEVQFCS